MEWTVLGENLKPNYDTHTIEGHELFLHYDSIHDFNAILNFEVETGA